MHFWVVFRSKQPVSTIFPPYIMPNRTYERIKEICDTLPLRLKVIRTVLLAVCKKELGLIQGILRCFSANCNMSQNTCFLCYFETKYSSVLLFTLFPSLPAGGGLSFRRRPSRGNGLRGRKVSGLDYSKHRYPLPSTGHSNILHFTFQTIPTSFSSF